MAVTYPEFGDFCDVAAEILGTTPEQIARLPNIGLAESALAAPRAGFGDVEVYPTILERAAILLERLTRNHPLPDGLPCASLRATAVSRSWGDKRGFDPRRSRSWHPRVSIGRPPCWQ